MKASRWAREATSGTMPPKRACSSIDEAVTSAMSSVPRTSATPVSSHVDSRCQALAGPPVSTTHARHRDDHSWTSAGPVRKCEQPHHDGASHVLPAGSSAAGCARPRSRSRGTARAPPGSPRTPRATRPARPPPAPPRGSPPSARAQCPPPRGGHHRDVHQVERVAVVAVDRIADELAVHLSRPVPLAAKREVVANQRERPRGRRQRSPSLAPRPTARSASVEVAQCDVGTRGHAPGTPCTSGRRRYSGSVGSSLPDALAASATATR